VIPIELELHNFLAYREPGPLRLEGIHIACLAGPNGAGKSSVLDAITWVLWGKARSGSPDELIHQGQTEMRVDLTFEQDQHRYRVLRQRKAGKRGQSILELQVWDEATSIWRPLSENSMRATQEKIEALLHLDYETFVNSAFLMQGRADEFTKKAPSQRKQILGNILGLERWEILEDRAKETLARLRSETQRLEGRLEEIERELAQAPAYQQELAAAEAVAEQVARALTAAEGEWATLEQSRSRLVALQRQIDDLTRRITAREKEIGEAEAEHEALSQRADTSGLQAALEEVRVSLSELELRQTELIEANRQALALASEASRLKGVNEAMGPETEPLKARSAALEDASEPQCPTCGQALTDDHRARLLRELAQEIESRRDQYRNNQGRIREIEVEASSLDHRLADLQAWVRQRPAVEKRAGELEAALQHADQAARQAVTLAKKIERWKAECEADVHARQALEREADSTEQALRAASLTQADIDRLRLEKHLADVRVGGARQKMATLESLERQRVERVKARQDLAVDQSLYESLRMAFGKQGVPAMIIETVVPEIEHTANQLLERMTDGRLHVRIETQREIKTGELREALDIIISDDLGSRPYDLYSGGEAFRVNFAIRIALSRLLARRAGAQLRSLFIDEGFGTQDADGREHVVAAINAIQDDFDRILVITHIDELKDAFPTRIEVRKTPTGSMFSLT
jgi:exonuclease SbcC